MTEGIEFIITEDVNFENFYHENTYQKCKKMVNYICKYNRFSENCFKLYKNCEKFKENKEIKELKE
jgi:hypothetical protein